MERYAILRRQGNALLKGGTGIRDRSADGSPPEFAVAELARREVVDVARDPRTEAMARIMPTRLIQPLGGSQASVGDSWGVRVVAGQAGS